MNQLEKAALTFQARLLTAASRKLLPKPRQPIPTLPQRIRRWALASLAQVALRLAPVLIRRLSPKLLARFWKWQSEADSVPCTRQP